MDPWAEDRDEEMICGAVYEHLPEKGAENSAAPPGKTGNQLRKRILFSEYLDGNSGFQGSLPDARNGKKDRTGSRRSSRVIFSCQRTSPAIIKNIRKHIRSSRENRPGENVNHGEHEERRGFTEDEPGFVTRVADTKVSDDFKADLTMGVRAVREPSLRLGAQVSFDSSATSSGSIGAASSPCKPSETTKWSGSSSMPGRPNTCIRRWASRVIP